MERLSILYDHLVEDIKGKGYLQVEESPIKVLDSGSPPGNKKGACHQGYYWVYHSPLDSTVLFNYQPARAEKATLEMLGNFKGYLQSDGGRAMAKVFTRRLLRGQKSPISSAGLMPDGSLKRHCQMIRRKHKLL